MVYDDFDMSKAARSALFSGFGDRYDIAIENVPLKKTKGDIWLRFDYIPTQKIYRTIDRKCITLEAMIQIGVIFPPDSGSDRPRLLAKEIANFFKDGKILDVGYIFEGASSHPMQKSETGWLLPIRFVMRYDEKEQ